MYNIVKTLMLELLVEPIFGHPLVSEMPTTKLIQSKELHFLVQLQHNSDCKEKDSADSNKITPDQLEYQRGPQGLVVWCKQ